MSVLSLALTPWGPVLLLMAAAVVLLPVNVRRLPRAVQAITLLALGLTWAWVMVLSLSPAPVVAAEVVQAPLNVAVYALFRVDEVSWPFAALVVTVGLAGALLLPMHPPAGRVSGPSAGLMLIAGALLMVISGNLLALFVGWVIVDGAYLALLLEAHPRATGRAVRLALLGPLILWFVLAALPPERTIAPWNTADFPTWVLVLLALTVWLRVGAYPLHRQHRVHVPGLPVPWLWLDAVVGGVWLARWATLRDASLLWGHQTWVVMGVFAFFGSALAAWLSQSPEERVNWILVQRTSTLVLVPLLGAPPWEGWVFSLGAAVVLAGSVLLVSQRLAFPRADRWVFLAAAAILWGLPFTLGAPVRALLARAWVWHPLAGLLLILGDGLVAGALLLPDNNGRPRGDWRAGVRVGVFLVAALVLSAGASNGTLLSPTAWTWTTLAPLVIGMFVAWQYERIFMDVREWVWSLEVLAYLEPLENTARNAVTWLLAAIGGIIALVEGAGWIGWLVLAALVTVVVQGWGI